LAICVLLLVSFRLLEWRQLRGNPAALQGWKTDPSAYLVMVPWALTIVGSLVEYVGLHRQPTLVGLVIGTLLGVLGVSVRISGLRSLGRHFVVAVQVPEDHTLVQEGLYRHLRHPLYLGNLLLMFSLGLVLGVTYTWAAVALGVVGVVWRIRIEERLLLEKLPGYAEYRSHTAALIPGLW
ncbi:isoprenylcysteine carboxylmethyltransferase family protein, partial [bacterium]|nr:isoprenylcysteine carboxylmethyltransferase family protein [bacterium]